MADVLKQRLIGALLVLSVIILLAFFLVKNATENVAEDPVSANETEFSSSVESLPIETAEPGQEALVDPHSLAEGTSRVVAEKPTEEAVSDFIETTTEAVESQEIKTPVESAEAKKVVDKDIEPVEAVVASQAKQTEQVAVKKEQWLIQLASFSQKPNALALQSKVEQLGLTANIEHVGTVYRVRVGPENSREAAEKLVARLSNELKLKPQILTVKPD